MNLLRHAVIRAGLEALYFSGAHALLRPILSGVGTIFTLHHVRPAPAGDFQPNRHLEVTPDFLRAMLLHLKSQDIDIVTMDEVHHRLSNRKFARRFAALTFDDGYRDNRDFALPIMREFAAPFTVFVTCNFAEGATGPWWVALERAIAKAATIEVTVKGKAVRLDTSTASAKQGAFDRLEDWMRGLQEHELRREIGALCAPHRVDQTAICRDLCMSWDELKAFADDPLVTIGAHTISHSNLALQSQAAANEELTGSRARIEERLQRTVLHLAYPYGDRFAAGAREFALATVAGFKTAVTTRPGMVFPESADRLCALPRVSLNGNYQERRVLPVLTSGAATAMWNGFRRVDAA
jgi:peptidoglycan/xylan/chitin deacetylase (PgdA/CDA1 family)